MQKRCCDASSKTSAGGIGRLLTPLMCAVGLSVMTVSVVAETATSAGNVAVSGDVAAAQHSDSTATSALIDALGNMKHFKANFAQFTQDSEGTVLQEIKGQVHLARPQRFHWEIKEPYRQTLVVQTQKLWILDDDLEQVTVQSLSTQVGLTPAILLSGDPAQIQQHYDVTMKPLPNEAKQFVLRPRAEEGLFDQLNVVIHEGQLKEMDFRDTLGQRTAINFSQGQLNQPFDESIFMVTVPEGYDFIEDF